MKAIVVGIESGAKYTDKQERVMLRFADADSIYAELRFAAGKLGLSGLGTGVHLDQEIEVELSVPKVRK